jgi:hypothetical protein
MGRYRYNKEQLNRYYFFVNKNKTITKHIQDINEFKDFSSSKEFIYSALGIEDIIHTDLVLEMQYIPMHNSWIDGDYKKECQSDLPYVVYELETPISVQDVVGRLICGSLVCHKCGKNCTSMSGYTLHVKNCKKEPESKGGVIFKCNICGKSTISRYGLTNHIKTMHPEVKL